MNEVYYLEFETLLKEFEKLGVFRNQELVLIGSWVLRIYKAHYPEISDNFVTSDVDFSINRSLINPHKYSPSLGQLLSNLSYEARPKGLESGKFVPSLLSDKHLDIEFIMLEKTARNRKGDSEYFVDSRLGVPFSPLPFQDVLTDNAIFLDFNGIRVLVPKPEYWAVHKIARSQTRQNLEKSRKDLWGASEILKLIDKKDLFEIGQNAHVSKKWKIGFNKGWKAFIENIE